MDELRFSPKHLRVQGFTYEQPTSCNPFTSESAVWSSIINTCLKLHNGRTPTQRKLELRTMVEHTASAAELPPWQPSAEPWFLKPKLEITAAICMWFRSYRTLRWRLGYPVFALYFSNSSCKAPTNCPCTSFICQTAGNLISEKVKMNIEICKHAFLGIEIVTIVVIPLCQR
jgi:hypothetical protein